MEDTEAYSVEDLLNFQGLEVEDDDDDKLKNPSSFSTISNPDDDSTPSFPETAEEELEWLDKDAFPNIDTFVDIISVNPGCAPKNHRSPVSVLENSSCSSNSISTNSTTIMTTCSGGFPAPIRRARTNRRRRHRRGGFADLPSQHWWWVSDQVKTYGKGTVTTVTKASTSSIGRKCQHCGAEKTPQWRAGPMGPKTLCNACGVRYKSGRLVPEYRPASSPTFSSQLHSNSHRKIVEMRRLKQNNMMVNNTFVDTG